YLSQGLADGVASIVEGIAWIDRSMAALLGKLPGISSEATQSIQDAAKALRESADTEFTRARDLALEAMPSDILRQKLEQWEKDAQAAAESVAASVSGPTAAYE